MVVLTAVKFVAAKPFKTRISHAMYVLIDAKAVQITVDHKR